MTHTWTRVYQITQPPAPQSGAFDVGPRERPHPLGLSGRRRRHRRDHHLDSINATMVAILDKLDAFQTEHKRRAGELIAVFILYVATVARCVSPLRQMNQDSKQRQRYLYEQDRIIDEQMRSLHEVIERTGGR